MYELQEAQQSVFGVPAEMLVEKWKHYTNIIESTAKAQGRSCDDLTLMTTAVCLENLSRYHERMDESTLSVNVGSFIHHGFDLIAAVMPSLIANDIVSVQPQTRKTGEIFYLEFLYGTTKGSITAGDTMFGWQQAGNSNIDYSSDLVGLEPLVLGDGDTQPPAANANMLPLLAGSLIITDALSQEIFTDDGAGVLAGSAGGSGTVNYANGAIALTYAANIANGTQIFATYRTDFEATPGNIPEVNLHIQSIPVIARPRKLRARYTLDAAFDVNAAFGRSVGAELDVALASEIRQEIDGEMLEALRTGYSAGTLDWAKTPPAGISYAEHKWTFLDDLIKVKSLIFTATRRATGNFIVAGTDVCNVIESLAPRFKPAGQLQPGPHFIGTLDGSRVYKNPYYPNDEAIVGYKGSMFMESGLVYAPYMPLYTTKPIMLDDFVTRKGMATQYAKKMVNPKFYARMRVV